MRPTAETETQLGPVDILVNNAGVAGLNANVADYPIDEWDRVMRINLRSQFLCCRAFVGGMVARDYGRIANVASIAGKEGNPTASSYSASKAGVIALTKSLAKETAGNNISVNAIAPVTANTRILEQVSAGAHRLHAVQDPARPLRHRRGDRRHHRLHGVGRVLLHHRLHLRHLRRPCHLLTPPRPAPVRAAAAVAGGPSPVTCATSR